jgi:hypothetical protein
MLMRILIIALLLSLPFSVSAKETNNQWFSEFGVGIDMGVSLLEEAPGLDYNPGFAVGPDLYWGILRHGMHRASLNLGYLYYVSERVGGTEQLEAVTSYQRLNLAGGYDICYKLLVVGAQVGTAMMIISTERTFREIELVDIEDGVFVFEKGDTISSQKETGVDWGFFAGLSVGIDFSHLYPKDKDTGFLEMRLKTDYVRRGERDDFFVSAVIIFWPTSLIK